MGVEYEEVVDVLEKSSKRMYDTLTQTNNILKDIYNVLKENLPK